MPSAQRSKSSVAVELHVRPAQADALAVDAGEVGLAADPAAVAAVERVIPDVQFPGGRRVDRRDEVDRVVDHVDDVFVGADAVERRDLVVRQLVGVASAAPSPSARSRRPPPATCPTSGPAGPSSATPRSGSCRGSRPPSAGAGRGGRRATRGSRRPRRRSASGNRGSTAGAVLPSKNCFWKYQQGPQLRTQPTSRSSPRMCRIMSSGRTPSVGLS